MRQLPVKTFQNLSQSNNVPGMLTTVHLLQLDISLCISLNVRQVKRLRKVPCLPEMLPARPQKYQSRLRVFIRILYEVALETIEPSQKIISILKEVESTSTSLGKVVPISLPKQHPPLLQLLNHRSLSSRSLRKELVELKQNNRIRNLLQFFKKPIFLFLKYLFLLALLSPKAIQTVLHLLQPFSQLNNVPLLGVLH